MGVVNHQRGVVNPEIAMVSKPPAMGTCRTDQSSTRRIMMSERTMEEDEEESDTGDEEREDEGGDEDSEGCYEGLTAVQMLELLSKIGDPKCTIKKLE